MGTDQNAHTKKPKVDANGGGGGGSGGGGGGGGDTCVFKHTSKAFEDKNGNANSCHRLGRDTDSVRSILKKIWWPPTKQLRVGYCRNAERHFRPEERKKDLHLKIKHSAESWQSRAKLQSLAKAQWLNVSRPSGGSRNKISDTRKKHFDICNVGCGDCLVHNFEQDIDCGFANHQTQHWVNLMHHPAKVTQMISMMEQGWVSVTICSRQIHQTRHNRGLKWPTSVGKIVGGNPHQIRGI